MILTVLKAIFWGALLLSILVGLHEGGHYLLARASNMRVTEFFLGMPCSLKLSFCSKSRGTEFGVTPVLLGGYTKICGMEGLPSDQCSTILAYIASHGYASLAEISSDLQLEPEVVQKDLDVLVDWASIEARECYVQDGSDESEMLYGTMERDAELRTIYDKGNDFTLEGSTKSGEPHALVPLSSNTASCDMVNASDQAQTFFERERACTYLGKGFVPRVLTLVAGPFVNIILGLVSVALVLSISGVLSIVDVSTISEVSSGSLAEQAGMVAGDTITSVNGVSTQTWTGFSAALSDAANTTDSFVIEFKHAGSDEVLSFTVDSTELKEAGMLGVTATTERYHPHLLDSLQASWSYVIATARYIIQLFMPEHTAEIVSQSSSVVGISVMASEAAESGAADYIYLLAAVSLSLGFMNLIPIPPLDGGKLLLEIIGLIRRKPVSIKVQERLSYAGLALFLLLFVVAMRQDILRYVLGG